ncbi:hypothetical protein LDO26_11925 [Luteimonas sp. BDR2-5]|uniref:DUF6580 family putative transport protein n=1 Tax=Proluteimonas luteida TaxID=2878685 RepID=UPI001E33C67D|nr:DUF6580 family putative transport protein [Luteimonas sp. BDR2-5]MCD9028916.1 hypothetical protein [Luteimonas sp. BDR2-5]
MSRPAPAFLAPGPLLLAALIFVAALTRLLPHPPNFSPVAAIALFAGAHFASRPWAFLVPLLAMLVSDLVLAGLHGGLYASWFASPGPWVVYLCIALTTALGFGMRGRAGPGRVLGHALAGALLFFTITNFAAWLFQPEPLYPMTGTGLVAAYVAGIPFFKWTLAATLLYSALLFGGFGMLRRHAPALRASTV